MSVSNLSFSPGFVSLTGKAHDQRPVTVLRDTGGAHSLILADVLPLSEESACDADTIVQGIGMGFVPAPLHRIHVQSNLKTGFFPGNDIAGGKVYPSPEVVDIPIAEPRHDDLIEGHPDLFSVSVLTRAQARKQAQDVDLSDSVFLLLPYWRTSCHLRGKRRAVLKSRQTLLLIMCCHWHVRHSSAPNQVIPL